MYIQIVSSILSIFAIALNFCIRDSENEKIIKYSFIATTIISLISSIYIFNFQENGVAFHLDIIGNLTLSFGSSSVSNLFAILTAFIMALVSFEIAHSVAKKDLTTYINLILLTNIGLMGCFFSLDLASFFIFFEISIIPVFFIILLFGGKEKVLAAKQFLTYTIAGSSLILVSTIYLYAKTKHLIPAEIMSSHGFSLISEKVKITLCVMMLVGFFVKIPTFLFHTWLPLAHVQAPTSGSMILAGILIKLGGFGILQFIFPIFYDQISHIKGYCIALGLISLIYGSLIAFAQTDIKKMIAYSSIAHMAYVVLGIFSQTAHGIRGAVFQMISHGVISTGLFFMIGILYSRFKTRSIDDYGRLYEFMPLYSKAFLLFSFAACAMPGTIGFVGEFMTVISLASYSIVATLIAASATLLGAIYMLHLCYKLLFSNPHYTTENHEIFKLSIFEKTNIVLISFVIIFFGVFPNFILKFVQF